MAYIGLITRFRSEFGFRLHFQYATSHSTAPTHSMRLCFGKGDETLFRFSLESRDVSMAVAAVERAMFDQKESVCNIL